MILRDRNAGATAAQHAPSLGLRGLLASPTLWGLMLTQGCAVYTQYLFLTWLPNYLQTQKGIYAARQRRADGVAVYRCRAPDDCAWFYQ